MTTTKDEQIEYWVDCDTCCRIDPHEWRPTRLDGRAVPAIGSRWKSWYGIDGVVTGHSLREPSDAVQWCLEVATDGSPGSMRWRVPFFLDRWTPADGTSEQLGAVDARAPASHLAKLAGERYVRIYNPKVGDVFMVNDGGARVRCIGVNPATGSVQWHDGSWTLARRLTSEYLTAIFEEPPTPEEQSKPAHEFAHVNCRCALVPHTAEASSAFIESQTTQISNLETAIGEMRARAVEDAETIARLTRELARARRKA